MSAKRTHEAEVSEHEEGDGQASAGPSISSKPAKSGSGSKKRKPPKPSPGIVYISRLPPGMTPQKVKHLMARWGEVGRVYAQKRDAPSGYDPHAEKKKQKHTRANYSEAWVEFMDKSVAKTVAKMLNAEVIGGKKGDRWRDDIWTMKYLSGFKWEMLGEQVAYERQAHQSRLRNEITRSKAEQGEYLRNVELARVLDKRRAKRAAKEETDTAGSGSTGPAAGAGLGQSEEKAKRAYKQRKTADKEGMREKGMESVLGSVFG